MIFVIVHVGVGIFLFYLGVNAVNVKKHNQTNKKTPIHTVIYCNKNNNFYNNCYTYIFFVLLKIVLGKCVCVCRIEKFYCHYAVQEIGEV